jgi:threonine aldolase
MAARLAAGVADIEGVQVQRPVQANSVFAILPADVTEHLQGRYPFYVWDEQTGEVRWMTSFDTTEGDVDGFAAVLATEMTSGTSRRQAG